MCCPKKNTDCSDLFSSTFKKSPGACDALSQSCPLSKAWTAKITTVTFRSDHVDGGNKLLRKSGGEYKDSSNLFLKPEWSEARGGSADSHPISHTKAKKITIDVDIEIKFDPPGSGTATSIEGVSSAGGYLSFQKAFSQGVSDGTLSLTGLCAKGPLPNHVDLLDGSIDWALTVDGVEKSIGSTGSHRIYVTYDKPIGKMESPTANSFQETGPDQHVTEERLAYSVVAAKGVGVSNEKECVDAVFAKLLSLGVSYDLGKRWEPDPYNNTGITPKPKLHHFLWRCNAATATAECHNIAASFALACRILGVKDSFTVGYMYPWPSRNENHPTYDKRGDKILGKYNVRYSRNHSGESHGQEYCLFIDGNSFVNNFEGVAAYRGHILYAIGEGRYDLHSTADENSSLFYSKHDTNSSTGAVTSHDLSKGLFELCYLGSSYCKKPYPWKTALVSYAQPGGWTLVCAPFFWHE